MTSDPAVWFPQQVIAYIPMLVNIYFIQFLLSLYGNWDLHTAIIAWNGILWCLSVLMTCLIWTNSQTAEVNRRLIWVVCWKEVTFKRIYSDEISFPKEIVSFDIQETSVHKQPRNIILGLRHIWVYFYPLNVSLVNNSWLLFFLKGQPAFIQFTRSAWEYLRISSAVKSFHWISFFPHKLWTISTFIWIYLLYQ